MLAGMATLSDSPIALRASHADWIERAAVAASAMCLAHCLALPLVLAALPALAQFIALPESVHLYILLFAVPSSLVALLSGRARHGSWYPSALGIAGLAGLALGIVPALRAAETWITVAGSLSLASAHVLNWRLRHSAHAHA